MIAAVNGVCAGGGLHFVADADIVIVGADRDLRRSARLGRPGDGVRDDRARKKSPMEAVLRHGVRRPPRTAVRAARAYELGICSQVVDPPERCGDERKRWARRSPGTRPSCSPRRSGRCGARWNAVSVSDPTIGTAIVSYIEPASGQGARVQPVVRDAITSRRGARRPRRVRGAAIRRDDARARRCGRRGGRLFGDPGAGLVPRGRAGCCPASKREWDAWVGARDGDDRGRRAALSRAASTCTPPCTGSIVAVGNGRRDRRARPRLRGRHRRPQARTCTKIATGTTYRRAWSSARHSSERSCRRPNRPRTGYVLGFCDGDPIAARSKRSSSIRCGLRFGTRPFLAADSRYADDLSARRTL